MTLDRSELWKLLSSTLPTLLMLACAQAGVGTTGVRETIEFVFKQFSHEAAEMGAETLTRRVTQLAARYGDTALIALRRSGPKIARLAEDSADPALAMRLLSRHGDDVARLVTKPAQLRLVADLGDEAAECLARHGDCVEPLLSALGPKAATALKGLSSQNARRLAICFADGELTKLGKSDDILRAVADGGDACVAWLWKHRTALTTTAVLTGFLVNPRPYLEAGTELTGIVAESAVQPVVSSVAGAFPWLLVSVVLSAAGLAAVWIWRVPRTAKSVMLKAAAKVARRFWSLSTRRKLW